MIDFVLKLVDELVGEIVVALRELSRVRDFAISKLRDALERIVSVEAEDAPPPERFLALELGDRMMRDRDLL